jgi:predicted naringenin-chalcone synthase
VEAAILAVVYSTLWGSLFGVLPYPMYLLSLANRVPSHRFQQKVVWNSLLKSTWAKQLRPGAMQLLDKVLNGNSGIETRHFCLPDLDELFTLNAEGLNQRFEQAAPELGTTALQAALDQAGLRPDELDALFVCTCTGYICPGLASHISHRSGLRSDAFLLDFSQANPQARVACIAVEVCSAAFYLDNDPGVLISAALFADGASAGIWGGKKSGSEKKGIKPLFCDNFQTMHLPEKRELLRFVNADGKLRNVLDKTVPALAAETVAQLYSESITSKPHTILIHPGGKKVIEAVEAKLPAVGYNYSREVLRQNGNMSSPSVLFALELALNDGVSEAWLCSFGAGYTCYACRVKEV